MQNKRWSGYIIGAVIIVAVVTGAVFMMNSKKVREGKGPEITAEEQAIQPDR